MTPAIIRRIARQVLPWLDDEDPAAFDAVGGQHRVTVYATEDRWAGWSSPPTRQTATRTRRVAVWWSSLVVVVLVVDRPVTVDA